MSTNNAHLSLIHQILQEASVRNASDVHLISRLKPYIRVDGELRPLVGFKEMPPKLIADIVFALLTQEQKERFIENRDLDFSYQTPDKVRYRINLHWEKGNIGMAARIILSKIPSMEEIELPKIAYGLIQKPAGLVLVTGPTGCGKSTTLASMIETINESRASHIITLEDPIEFIYTPKKSIIKQRQLGIDMMSFGAGLKHILRQDPNVILVGEMRDLETMAATITLAETGHLVFATLHTYSAAQTIDRIIDTFPPYQQQQIRLQLSLVLEAIISQRLLPRISGGRTAAREILINNAAISNMIRENKLAQIENVIQTSASEGMVSMDQALIKLYQEDIVTRQDAEVFISSPTMLDF